MRASEVPAEGLTIAEAAHRTGVSVHTLRYYERAGLVVSPVDRKIDIYRGSLAAGEAGRLWAPAAAIAPDPREGLEGRH